MFNNPVDANHQTLHNAIPIYLSIVSSSKTIALVLELSDSKLRLWSPTVTTFSTKYGHTHKTHKPTSIIIIISV